MTDHLASKDIIHSQIDTRAKGEVIDSPPVSLVIQTRHE